MGMPTAKYEVVAPKPSYAVGQVIEVAVDEAGTPRDYQVRRAIKAGAFKKVVTSVERPKKNVKRSPKRTSISNEEQ
jgi:hypothetical protein